MTEFALVKEALSAGGDIAIIALLVIMWRFDRRLVKMETIMRGCLHNCKPKQ